jgi:hypothetical protein
MKFDLSEYGKAYNSQISLYLIPVDPGEEGEIEVYTFGCIGSGTPGAAYHQRHLGLGSVPRETVASELQTWLKGNEETLTKIASHYRGTAWNGSNHVGQWSGLNGHHDGELDELLMEFERKLSDASTYNEIACYWQAGDWYTNSMPDARKLATSERDLAEVAAEEVVQAQRDGVWLDADDVEEFLSGLREQAAKENDEG